LVAHGLCAETDEVIRSEVHLGAITPRNHGGSATTLHAQLHAQTHTGHEEKHTQHTHTQKKKSKHKQRAVEANERDAKEQREMFACVVTKGQ
jgi:hypothetical protein